MVSNYKINPCVQMDRYLDAFEKDRLWSNLNFNGLKINPRRKIESKV
jgi:hypothetical protein